VSNRRWVIAHGKRIEVEDLDDPPHVKARAAKRAKRREEAFAMLPLEWAADAAKAIKMPRTMVLVLLQYMAWKTKSQTFPLPNGLLAQYGVSRELKRRVLAKLEASGLIEIERQGKQNPTITLLTKSSCLRL
jgi:hypothetical protein